MGVKQYYFKLILFILDKPPRACEYLDTDLPGNDIDATLNVATWEDCSELCSRNRDCTSWTWVADTYTINPKIIRKCHLKDGNPARSGVTGLISGVAGCKQGQMISYLTFYKITDSF